ncbi:MAG TPA: VOC family protein [Acidimicrobiales bacterium]|nr:VOC family protein [Acidimicrobiales bacterium]
MDDPRPPAILGFHHVRVPVRDAVASRDWYRDVLGLDVMLDLEEEDGLVGVVMQHSGVILGLHADPERAEALAGFTMVALDVGSQAALADWVEYLDAAGVVHSGVREGHLGLVVEVADPDGIVVQLHTAGQPSADGA